MKPRFTAFYQLLPVLTIVLLAGCAAHKRVPVHNGYQWIGKKEILQCRSLEILSYDAQHKQTIFKCNQ